MNKRLAIASPRTRARLTGVVYLRFFATAVLGSVIAPGISGPGATSDAATTANNIVTHQTAFRIGWALDLTSTALYVALANQLLTPLELLGFLAEASLMLWLLVVGVNSQRWTEQAA